MAGSIYNKTRACFEAARVVASFQDGIDHGIPVQAKREKAVRHLVETFGHLAGEFDGKVPEFDTIIQMLVEKKQATTEGE